MKVIGLAVSDFFLVLNLSLFEPCNPGMWLIWLYMYAFNELGKGPFSDAKHPLPRLLMAQGLKIRRCKITLLLYTLNM